MRHHSRDFSLSSNPLSVCVCVCVCVCMCIYVCGVGEFVILTGLQFIYINRV